MPFVEGCNTPMSSVKELIAQGFDPLICTDKLQNQRANLGRILTQASKACTSHFEGDPQVATQAVVRMPGLLVFPVLPAAATAGLLFWWIFISVYIYGSGGRLTCLFSAIGFRIKA